MVGAIGITFVLVREMLLAGSAAKKKALLSSIVILNVGLLCIFKYLGLFRQLTASLGSVMVSDGESSIFPIVAPLGLSFISFKLISYAIDAYRGDVASPSNAGVLLTYGLFFSQVTAGPIQRAQSFFHQLAQPVRFDFENVSDGLKLILWGVFKKAVVADRMAVYVNQVFDHSADQSGMACLVASYCYAIQIYCDFSGYTDVAIGIGKVFGFVFPENFCAPYFANSIGDFWRRWHITLSSWLRDYLYIPLGGSRVPRWRHYLNIGVVFILCGLWHGAGATFVVWGGIHGLYLVIGHATQSIRSRIRECLGLKGTLCAWWQQLITFQLVTFAWIFFRAKDIGDALSINQKILYSGTSDLAWLSERLYEWEFIAGLLAAGVVFLMEGTSGSSRSLVSMNHSSILKRWSIIYALILAITFLGVTDRQDFIYSQF
jgi:D-alanyl-lipoteichoic acid acyltransferase DltB (MBOAT superfamily)